MMSYLRGLSRQTNVCETKLQLTCIYNPNVALGLFSAFEIPVIISPLLYRAHNCDGCFKLEIHHDFFHVLHFYNDF